jgi:hypothetical protein
MIVRSFLLPLKSDLQKPENVDSSSNSARSEDRHRDKDLLAPKLSQRESIANSQSTVPDNVIAEFETFKPDEMKPTINTVVTDED